MTELVRQVNTDSMPQSLLRGIDAGLSVVERLFLAAVCVLSVVLMFVVSGDALGRYLFNQPFDFTIDLVTRYLLPATLFLGLSETLRRGDHISVGAFAKLLPKRAWLLLLGICLALSAILATLVVIETSALSYQSWHRKIISFGPYAWPKWVEEALVAISWAALAARLWYAGATYLVASVLDSPEVAMPISAENDNMLEEGL